jgi:RND family efflux transporter MFP subunit
MTTGTETAIPREPKPAAQEPQHGSPARRENPRPVARRKPVRWPYYLGAMLLLFLAIGIWQHVSRSRAEQQFEQANSQVIVNVATVHRSSDAYNLVLPGSVDAFQSTTLYARSNGFLGKWLVDIGDNVQKGQTLAIIETPDLDQQLHQAQDNLAQATSNAELARVTSVRWQALYEQKVVSAQDNDQQQSNYRAAAAAQAAAQANVNQLKQLVGFNQIIAPFAGRITYRHLDVGALVSAGSGAAGTAIYDIAQTDPLRIYVYVPQSDAPMIHIGTTAHLLVREHPGTNFVATVTRTAGAIDPNSRTLLTELDIPNKDGLLYAGMYANVQFALGQTAQSPIVVSANAYMFRTPGAQVAVVRDGKTYWQSIQIGRDFGTQIEVVSGLKDGDTVVINPTDEIQDGLPVKTQALPSQPSAGAQASPKPQ